MTWESWYSGGVPQCGGYKSNSGKHESTKIQCHSHWRGFSRRCSPFICVYN